MRLELICSEVKMKTILRRIEIVGLSVDGIPPQFKIEIFLPNPLSFLSFSVYRAGDRIRHP